jgi:hypothetical protein
MAPVDTKNSPPDNVQDITTASGNGSRRRGKPVPQHLAQPTAPLIDSPGDVDLFDMNPTSIVRRYHDEAPAAPVAPVEEPGDTGAGQAPCDARSNGSQSAEELVEHVQHPTVSAAAPAPSQSDDELIEQLEELQQGSRAVIPVTGTAYFPADTPTSRPEPPRRSGTPHKRRTPRPTLTRARSRKAYLSAVGLLVVAVAITAVATNSGPRARIASGGTTPASSGLVVTPTKIVNPLKLIAAAIAPAVKKQEAADRSRARRAAQKTSRRHHTHHAKRTAAPPVHPAASAPSQVATTTATLAPTTSSNSNQPAATKPQAPSQQAGPTGPGTTVGKNCDPQCS